MRILGIESSCDDTSAAVVQDGRRVLSCVVATQDAFHEKYGGVVPEIASRRHIEVIDQVMAEALEQAGVGADGLDGVAATQGPGLIGSLLVGLNYAKAFAFGRGLPFVGVNHVEAHLFAARLDERAPEPPFVGLVVSGGHTNLYHVSDPREVRLLGKTVDDAAGECLDKSAKLLGLGFPGGAALDRLAEEGDASAVPLPRPMIASGDHAFSFSGLKTAVKSTWTTPARRSKEKSWPISPPPFVAAVADVLAAKLFHAAEQTGARRIVIAGGVAASRRLRERVSREAEKRGMDLFIPDLTFCTDNAAMIAAAGTAALRAGERSDWSLDAFASLGGRGRGAS
ncbi:MAG: tRNA (adenosine(37)-N6)-threonylcarbamoyltransferase complex transferase subunit TsaD [Deltaproteobacteria bacterium]|nr:tRNA (adenosine(37)-N6)-threonylcarbamoyltransferase complex transferase subunit TsaD [Deltaproteobacteria bacterium]